MTDAKNDPVDQANEPGGRDGEQNQSVSYDSFQKVLGEKKKAAEKLRAMESKLSEMEKSIKEREETELAEQNKWKEFADRLKAENEELNGKLGAINEQQLNAKKLNSFFDALGSRVDKRYWNLIDIDKIMLEGDEVDEFSVSKYVEEFKTSFPEVIQVKETRKMPNDSPSPASTGQLTYEQWKALPKAEKESRIGDVVMN